MTNSVWRWLYFCRTRDKTKALDARRVNHSLGSIYKLFFETDSSLPLQENIRGRYIEPSHYRFYGNGVTTTTTPATAGKKNYVRVGKYVNTPSTFFQPLLFVFPAFNYTPRLPAIVLVLGSYRYIVVLELETTMWTESSWPYIYVHA